jgi:prepilin-type N-terminal cleavage/methylation domain-containing protein
MKVIMHASGLLTAFRRRRGSPAFTLIELLVVIAIIALLIAILLPSLEAARKASKKSVCVAHIRNIASSSRVYEADDPSGWGIPVHPRQFTQDASNPTFVGAYEWGGKSGIGRPGYAGFPGELGSKYGTIAGFGPPTRPMNNILYPGGFKDNLNPALNLNGCEQDTKLDLSLYTCPADDGPPRGGHCPDWVANSERSSYDHFGNSFAANVFLTGNENSVASNSPYLRPISRVPNPSRTLYYEENIGRWAWAARRENCEVIGDVFPGIDPGPTKAIRGWHGADWIYNRAFVDAHAEMQRILIDGTVDEEGYYLHYRNEHLTHYPAWFDGVEGDFDRYQCIIVRGDGWQKDTMPAPVIEVGIALYPSGRPSWEGCVDR